MHDTMNKAVKLKCDPAPIVKDLHESGAIYIIHPGFYTGPVLMIR